MVKDKAINVKPYKMERNGKEILFQDTVVKLKV